MKAIHGALVHTGAGFESDLCVLVEGDRIAGIVPPREVPAEAEVDDWGHAAIVPGTVNSHGHAFQNLLKGFSDDLPFESWRDDVLYPFSDRLDGDAIYAGALFAFAEALLAGATTTVDFFYLHDASNANAERVIEAAKDIGIRLVLARALYDPDAPTKAPARYREPARDAAQRCRDLADDYLDDPLVHIQPAPHSLHAASPETIRVALELAESLDAPCHLHLAEASYERAQIEERYGATPVRLLHREGLLNERLLAIHSVWVDDEEMDLLAASGAGVVHCPGANAFLGDGMARVPEMLSRGIRVALGPDGGCANNRQSVFDEMRGATLVAKAQARDGSALDARTAFRMGTEAGADLLGLPAGRLAVGSFADLVGLDSHDLSLQPPGQLERHIVHSMQPTAIANVMVGGRVVVRDHHLTTIRNGEIRKRVADVTAGWARPGS